MILLTYRINQKEKDVSKKKNMLYHLSQEALRNDRLWHYFLDDDGGTLRFQPKFENKFKLWSKQFKGVFSFRRCKSYRPERDEYYGVSYLGADILPMFHEMSVITAKYPNYVVFRPFLERLNHGLVDMSGIHDFRQEAEIYLDLAYGRAELGSKYFGTPKIETPRWLHKLYFRLRNKK